MPGRQVLNEVLTALQDAGIDAALGGSGLLAALGLTDHVRDWDVTTDADPHLVDRLRVDGADHDIDLIVGFPIRADDTVHHLPTRITGHWHGLPLADPAVWAQAYRLIGRLEPATALDEWLSTRPTSQQ